MGFVQTRISSDGETRYLALYCDVKGRHVTPQDPDFIGGSRAQSDSLVGSGGIEKWDGVGPGLDLSCCGPREGDRGRQRTEGCDDEYHPERAMEGVRRSRATRRRVGDRGSCRCTR
jgi:hypothetical protein